MRVFSCDSVKPSGASTSGFCDERFGVATLARDDDHKVVGVADEPVGRLAAASARLARPELAPIARHARAKCSSRADSAMLASSGERIPPCGVPVTERRTIGSSTSFEGGLHDAIRERRNPEPAAFAATRGDRPFPDRHRPVAPALELPAQPAEELLHAHHPLDVVGRAAVHAR